MTSLPEGDLPSNLPRFLSRRAAGALYDVAPRTILAHVQPDAWQISDKGLQYPLYTAETIEAFLATWEPWQWQKSGAQRKTEKSGVDL